MMARRIHGPGFDPYRNVQIGCRVLRDGTALRV